MTEAKGQRGRHALLIGIDRYKHCTPLHGCENDVKEMQTVLEIEPFGFKSTLLCNEDATREGILAALERLLQQVQPDDIVVVHYAGHGSAVKVVDEHKQLRQHEALLPVDAREKGGPCRDITDRTVNHYVKRLAERTPHACWIFDCCHSGTMHRDPVGVSTRSAVEAVYSPSQMPIDPAIDTEDSARQDGATPSAPPWRSVASSRSRYVVIAACREGETAKELLMTETQKVHGVFTTFLRDALLQANGETTYREIFDRVAVEVTARCPSQHPMLEGAADLELFGMRDLRPAPSVAITRVDDRGVTLASGAVLGVVHDSEWDIYPPGAKQPNLAQRLGRLRVHAVRATEAQGTIIEVAEHLQPTMPIAAHCRAIESSRPLRLQAGVQILGTDSAAEQRLSERLGRSSRLKVVGTEEVPLLRVERYEPGQTRGWDLRAEQPAVPSWLIFHGTTAEKLLVPPIPIEREAEVASISQAFAHATFVRQLHNPRGRLAQLVDFTLVPQPDSGIESQPGSQPGGPCELLEEGALLLRARNRSSQDVYVTVLCVNMDHTLSVLAPSTLVPAQGAAELLDGYPVSFSIPVEYLAAQRRSTGEEPRQGTDYLKVFLTRAPFYAEAWLEADLPQVRSVQARGLAGLASLFASRNAQSPDLDPADWDTLTRVVNVRRPFQSPMPAAVPAQRRAS